MPDCCFYVTLLLCLGTVRSQSIANGFFAEAGTNPGFYTRINQKGLDLMADYLKDRVIRFLHAGDLSFNVTSTISPETKMSLRAEKLEEFEEKTFESRLESQAGKGLLWTGKNLNLTVQTTFTIETAAGELLGTAPMLIENADVEFLLWTGLNSDGHLKTDLVTCKVSGGSGSLQLASTDIAQLGEDWGVVQENLNQNLDQVLCPTFHAELVPVISNRLLNTPLSASLFDQFFMNYGLLAPVQFEDGEIMMKHRGNAFGILRQGRTRLNDFRLPFRAGPLDPQTDSGRMVDIVIGNYTLSSLLFWMDQYRKFDYEISKTAQNNSALAGYLRTDCGKDDICAGTIFPALKERFPNGMVVIKSHTSSYPKVVITEGKARVFVETKIDAYVQQTERTRRFLQCNMAAEVKYDEPKFQDYVFKSKLRIDKFKLTDVTSSVDGIDANSLEFLVNALIELVLNDEMAEKMKGIAFPIIFDFDQQSVDVSFEKDRLRISVDYCYGTKCQVKTEESRDGNVDYYDQVTG